MSPPKSATTPVSAAIPVAEVATRAAQVPNLLRSVTEPLAPGAEVELIRKRVPELREQIDLEVAAASTILHADPTLDMVCGSRFAADLKYSAPVSRRTGIHIFAFLLSHIVGERITDPTSGFRLYNRSAIALFARDYPHDYPEVEAVLLVHFHRLRMAEVPVRMYKRDGGVSSINSGKSVYYMIKVLLAIFVGLVRARPAVEPGDAAPVAASPGL